MSKKLCVWRHSFLAGSTTFEDYRSWTPENPLYKCTLCSGRIFDCPDYRKTDLKWKYLQKFAPKHTL